MRRYSQRLRKSGPIPFAAAMVLVASVLSVHPAKGETPDIRCGRALAQEWCARCHAVAPEQERRGESDVPPVYAHRCRSALGARSAHSHDDGPAHSDASARANARGGRRRGRVHTLAAQIDLRPCAPAPVRTRTAIAMQPAIRIDRARVTTRFGGRRPAPRLRLGRNVPARPRPFRLSGPLVTAALGG